MYNTHCFPTEMPLNFMFVCTWLSCCSLYVPEGY